MRWYSANTTPLVLGLAVAIGMYDRHVTNIAARMRAQLLLPIVAILGAMPTPGQLVFVFGGATFTPMRLTLIAAALVYAHGLWMHRHVYFAWAGGMCLVLAGLGETPGAIAQNTQYLVRDLAMRGARLIPRTRTHWGITAVAASFVLLIIGAAVSLLRSRQVVVQETMPADDADEFVG